MNEALTQRSRRWFQFRLSKWLFLVLILSVAMVGYARYQSWMRQKKGRLQLEQTIDFYDYPYPPIERRFND